MTVAQTIFIKVRLDSGAAARELEREGRSAARRSGLPGSGSTVSARQAAKDAEEAAADTLGRRGMKTAARGAEKFAQAAGRFGVRAVVREAGMPGGGLMTKLAGRALSGALPGGAVTATATIGSALVIGVAVKEWLQHEFPQFFEVMKDWFKVKEITKALRVAQGTAQEFEKYEKAFAEIGSPIPGGALAFNEQLTKIVEAQVAEQMQEEEVQRKQLQDARSSVSFGADIQRQALTDWRAQLLKNISMR